MTTQATMTYQLHDHVQCRVSGNLFTGAIYALDLVERCYGVHAELPQGLVPMKIKEEEIVRKIGVWNP